MAVERKTSGSTRKRSSPAPKKASESDPMRESLEQEAKKNSTYDFDEDEEGEEEEEEILGEKEPMPTKIKIAIAVTGVVVFIALVAFVLILNNKPEPPPPPPAVEETEPEIDQEALDKQALYEAGIGKEFVDKSNIFEQGNIENNSFRKDFQGEDQPEKFVTPIQKIAISKDGVSYIKHRAVLDEGIELYWLEGEFHGKKCAFTIPYSIYQVIPATGVIDVNVEVVIDKNGSKTVTGFTAIPPAKAK